MEGNRPIKKFRSGNIESAIWLNEKQDRDGNNISFKTASIRKSWNQEGKWHDATINLRRGDISKAILVLQKAQEELLLAEELKEDEENE